jgi:hypothetical protein
VNTVILSNTYSQGEANEDIKRELMNYQSEVYWTKLSKIISEKTYNVWKSLDKGLLSYHDLLFERKKLVDQTKGQMDKNQELKSLLKKYMASEDNRALIVPPHHMIKKELMSFAFNDIN